MQLSGLAGTYWVSDIDLPQLPESNESRFPINNGRLEMSSFTDAFLKYGINRDNTQKTTPKILADPRIMFTFRVLGRP